MHVTVLINGCDITSVEEPVLIENVARVPEVGSSNGWPAHFQPSEGLAIAGQLLVFILDDLHLDAERRVPLLHLHIQALLTRENSTFRFQRPQRSQGTHFGHAPGMAHGHAIVILKCPNHFTWACGPADNDSLQVWKFDLLLFQILQQRHPYRRDRRGETDTLGLEQLVNGGPVKLGAWHHQRCTLHGSGQCQSPAIGVEHRHDRHDDVTAGNSHGVGCAHNHRMENIRSMRIDDALGVSRRT